MPAVDMQALAEIAVPFVEMAHRIVWCTVATVDAEGALAPVSSIRSGRPARSFSEGGGDVLNWRASG